MSQKQVRTTPEGRSSPVVLPTKDPQPAPESLWLYLHFPYLALESHWTGQDQDQALALCSGQQLVQLNPQALAAGVVTGMSLTSAYCLCPELKVGTYDEADEIRQLQSLAITAKTLVAQVHLCPPQGLLLEAASMVRWHGSQEKMWQHCLKTFAEAGFSVSQAFAPTPLAAQLLAEAGLGHSPFDADRATRQLRELPVSVLRLGTKIQRRLEGMGLTRLGTLQDLPPEELGYRFGAPLLQTLHRLNHADQSPYPRFALPEHFQQQLEFMQDVDNSQSLIFPLKRLLDALERFLHLRQLSVCELQLCLTHRKQESSLWPLRSLQAMHESEHFLHLARIWLERQQLPAPVIAIGLRCQQFFPRQEADGDLFASEQPPAHGRIIDLLQARLGPDALWSPAVVDDPCPERAWRAVAPGQGLRGQRAPVRPLWLLPHPQPVHPDHYQISAPPERISGSWWQQAIRRDYFIGHHGSGATHWLFRDDRGQWYLQGLFG